MFFAVPVLVAGCSEKERGEPRASVLLHLSYTFNTEERDLFSDVAASGDVLVYRGDGTLFEHRAMTPARDRGGGRAAVGAPGRLLHRGGVGESGA